MKRFLQSLLVLMLLFLLLIPVVSMASEREWGYVKVIGIKDAYCNGDRKFAPIAVYHNTYHAEDSDLYVEYHYMKVDNYTRVWGYRFVDENHKAVRKHPDVDIVFPYPSIWSADQGMYWKWTSDYASKKDWTIIRGFARFHENWSTTGEADYTYIEKYFKVRHRHTNSGRGMEFYGSYYPLNINPKYKFGFSICSGDLSDSYSVYKYLGSEWYPAVCIQIVDKTIPDEKEYDWETDSYKYVPQIYKQHLYHVNAK